MTVLLALLAACAPRSFEECRDALCHASMALRDWDADPEGTAAKVAALPEEVERIYVVEKLVEAHPGQTAKLCDSLPQGEARRRCARMNGRPHLAGHASPRRAAPAIARTAPGPSGTMLPVATLPLAPVPAPDDACTGVPDRGACVEEAAQALAMDGHAGAVPEVCGRAADEKMRDECVFFAAERVTGKQHADGYATAAALCAAAGQFAEPCQMHLLTYALEVRPLAPSMTEADAAAATRFADAVRDAWSPAGPEVADLFVGWFWSRWTEGAYGEGETVTGTPLDLLPAEATPHVRAAAAARLQALGQLVGTLDDRVRTVEAALAERPAPAGRGTFRLRTPQGGALWPEDATPEEAATPAAWYLGRDRRPVDPDPAVDLALAVVAAAAHASPPDEALLAEARTSGTPIVAAYATRVTSKKKAGPKAP